jgi:CRISPR-associated endonuclease Csn1
MAAHQKKAGEKVLIPSERENRRFKFSLMKNDCLLLAGPDGEEVLYRVQSLSGSELQLCPHSQTRVMPAKRTSFDRITSMDSLRKRSARKVEVDAIGAIRGEEVRRPTVQLPERGTKYEDVARQ